MSVIIPRYMRRGPIHGCVDRESSCQASLVLPALILVLAAMFFSVLDAYGAEDTAPQASNLRFEPTRPLTGDRVKLYFTLKNAIRAEVRWTVNDDEEDLQDYDGISGFVEYDQPLKAGDTLKASVTPFTGMGEAGKPAVKTVTFYNSPPTLKLERQGIKDGKYEAKIEVNDPEKGKVALKVEGPEGMVISDDGKITWPIKRGVSGNFQVKVTAKDEEGAEAVLTYAIRIRQEAGR